MEGIVALLLIFGSPVAIVFIVKYFKALEKGLVGPRARQGLDAARQQQLDALVRERQLLEARVQNLESIVCSVDLELNARLNRLAAEQSRALALPAPSNRTGGGAGAMPAAAAGPVPTETAPALAVVPATLATAPSGLAVAEVKPGHMLLGRYRVERELGRGGMGAVFLAHDAELREIVALKVITGPICCDNLGAVERFRREVAAARKVTHPNVIRIHDIGFDGGVAFLSMEYFPGMTLAQMLATRGALPVDEARHVLAQTALGLSAAHAAQVIHRDLKPQNILIDAQKRVKIIDFGLARASFLEGMTATGIILGTAEYMAPEQVQGRPVDARTDVYALGCVAYHALCGVPPFRSETPIATGFLHCTRPPVPPRQIRPELPPALEAAVLRALEKDPARRFQSAEEMRQALAA